MKRTCMWPAKWAYLYRAIDSTGDSIDFLLSPNRDLIAAKGFLRLALSAGLTRPRVINVDVHPAYASAIGEMKRTGELGRNCRCPGSPYMNNIIEQDHRFVKKRVVATLGFRSADGALSSIAGYEAMNIIRKGQIRGLPKGDIVGQKRFIERIFGIAALNKGSVGAGRRATISSHYLCDRTFSWFRFAWSVRT
jgi:transposase, IS6 family